jgi:hypothetical protein
MYSKTSLPATCVVGLAAASAALFSNPSRAANPGRLKTDYSGHIHHNNKPANENLSTELHISDVNPRNGHFSGFFGPVQIEGKVTSTGKVTFSGHELTMGSPGMKVSDGKGQLSATGLHFLGSFKVTQDTGPDDNDGSYTFDMHANTLLSATLPENSPLGGSAGLQAEAARGDFASQYAGAGHSNSKPGFENVSLSLVVSDFRTNGKFTGVFGGVPVHGNVSTTGKVTFSGKITSGGKSFNIQEGKAQLSATGLFLLGSFKGSGKLQPDQNGPYTFEFHKTVMMGGSDLGGGVFR